MGVSLYRKYRPQTFSDVVGQEGAVSVLEHAVASASIGHAYLLSGPRGCGKTTIARILAKALNCLELKGAEPCGECANCRAIAEGESMDVVEIDGASNNSVDEIRELKSHIALAPFSSKYKIYIIDEVHMLSAGAFNALLKTLEEPPAHVVFIMATTEPQKVPITVRSRCQHIPFHSIGAQQIADRLMKVCEWENVKATQEALWEVARQADGALRDALSILEQVINRVQGELKLEDVEAALGAGSRPSLERWVSGLRQDPGASYVMLKSMMQEGASAQRVFEELFALIKNMWLAVCWPEAVKALEVSAQEEKFLASEGKNWAPEDLRAILSALVSVITQARLGVRPDVLSGIFMLELVRILNHEQAPVLTSGVLYGPTQPQNNKQVQVQKNFGATINPTPNPPNINFVPREPVHEIVSVPSSDSKSLPDKLPDNVTPITPDLSKIPDSNWEELTIEKQIELFSTAGRADFVLYYGLLDAKPLCSGQRLLLDMQHRYCFETLRQRSSSGWEEIAALYQSGVFLRFREWTIVLIGPAKLTNQDNDVPGESQLPRPSMPQSLAYAPAQQARQMANFANDVPFGNIVNDLKFLLKGDLLLVRHENKFDDATDVEPEMDDNGEADDDE